jgi:peptidoglycan/LPS O-acetylase OafA/YrhL
MTPFGNRITRGIEQQSHDAAGRHHPTADEGRSMVQLDGLRALAVLAVLWSHWAPEQWKFGLPWGTGVQLFFVLSGFLITGILLDHRASGLERMRVWRSFYIRRALRIFPLFYLVLSLSLMIGLGNIRHTWMWHALYMSNFYYFTGNSQDVFAHFWSLAVEEQFYLVWPFLILLLPVRILPGWIIFMIILAPISRIILAGCGYSDLVIRLLPSSCLDALGTGALLAWTKRFAADCGWNPRRVALLCLLSGLPTYVLAGVFDVTGHAPYWMKTLGHTGMDLFYGWIVIEASVGFQGWIRRLLQSVTLTYIGRISYGIYVFHFFAPSLFPDLPFEDTARGYALRLAAYATLTFLIAATSWRFYERPLNRLKTLVPYS